ncbi:hypothetical protein BJY14_004985 [Actinomadura luteofluorescens]|uniref:Uncharacterized protein n=1 Tax=Actinomadura luteofluorescens TaxID=46163 RepID=A0A7Y9EJW8_9ACTN|nr:hypothetical protein [Actinomadura luteofluorescens]
MKAPIGCSDSAFTSSAGAPEADGAGSRENGTSGVRTATPAMRSAARSISGSDTRSDMPGDYFSGVAGGASAA